jgi:hypothetical protein
MKYGVTLAGMGANFVDLPSLSREAEEHGWDGVFIWDEMFGPDAWVVMTAVAMHTKTVRIGALLTPLSRRRPWKVANETATLDHLSNGRLVLAVGLGAWPREKSMQRVVRCDGILPEGKRKDGSSFNAGPQDVREIRAYVEARRTLDTPFDIVIQNESPGDDRSQARDLTLPWQEAGATWWIENPWASQWLPDKDPAGLRARIRQGPPR